MHELKIDKRKILEMNKNIIKMKFVISPKRNTNKSLEKSYEVNINFEPTRTNFIFDFKIGNLLNSNSISKFNGYNLNPNQIFCQFYNHIINMEELSIQPEMMECLAEDVKKYLEKTKNENNSLFFNIAFFFLIYSRNKDIQILFDLIKKRQTEYLDGFYKTEEIINFCDEIFSNYEKDENSWPFDEIKKFDNGGNEEEENEEKENEDKENEEKENEEKEKVDDDKLNTKNYFIEFFIGYFCCNKKLNELSLFFKYEKIKKITTKTLSKIKDTNIISKEGRKQFMKFFNNSEIFQILQTQTNFIQTLIIINNNFSSLFESVKNVGLEKYSLEYELINLRDNIEDINTIHKEILEKEKNINNFFIDFISCVPKFISIFLKNDLEQLIKIIEFIEDEKKQNEKIEKLNEFEKILKNAILSTIQDLIKNKKTICFIEIIPKIKKYFSEFSEKDKFDILGSTEINSNNAHQILDLILSEKIYLFFETNYDKFLNIIIKNIKGIEYLPKILQIIPKEKITRNIADKLYDWIIQNFKTYKPSQQIDTKNELNIIIKILIDKNPSKIEKFLTQINKSFSDENIVEYYINFLKNSLPKNINNIIINYFISKRSQLLTKKNKILLPYILSELKEYRNIVDDLLNKLKDNVIKEEEFYRRDTSENIILLNELIINSFFNNNKGEDEYTKKTIEVITLIKSKFENSSFIYNKAKEIYDNIAHNTSYKFKLLFLSNSEDIVQKAELLYKKFSSDVMKVYDVLLKLDQINQYFNEFYKISRNNEISKIQDLKYKIENSKLNEINNIINSPEYTELIKYLDLSEDIELKKSLCFIKIYNELSIQLKKDNINENQINEDILFQNSKAKFEEMKIIFENNIIDNNDSLRFLLDIALNDNNNNKRLDNELSFLKKYFNIKKVKINEIKNNIIIFAQENKINFALLGLLELFNIFQNNIDNSKENSKENDDIINKIKVYLEELKNDKINKEKIQEIILFLQSFNIFLDDGSNTSNNINKNGILFFEFLKLVQNNPEALIFAKDKKESNIKFLLDFFVESDGKKNLKENDVQGFIKTVKFLENLKNKKYTFSDLIKLFKEVITNKKHELFIGENINNYIKSINGIKILYNESLNKSEFSSLKISLILKNSIANISYQDIIIEYYSLDNKTKNILNFEEIEELRERALVMKSNMTKDKSIKNEEKNDNYNIVKIFIDLIQKIKLLKEYLVDLVNIGLPDPDNYNITVKIINKDINNNTNLENKNIDYSDINCIMGKKKLKLENLIDYLYYLKNEIEKQTEKFYINNEYIRFFYGKSLDFVNHKLKSKQYKELLPIFNAITNNTISNNLPDYNYHIDNNLFIPDNNLNNDGNIDGSYFDDNEEEINEDENNNKNNEEENIDENKNENNDNEKDINEDENNNKNNEEENITIKEENPINIFVNMLFNISNYFKNVLDQNNITSTEKIFKNNEIKEEEKEKNKGVYISTSSNENYEKKIIIYYKELTNSNPISSTVLLCNEETTKEEITCFLFRAFLCPSQSLFIISKSDSLIKTNKIYLISKISELLKIYKNDIKSLLIILHSVENSEIKKGFNFIKEVKIFNIKSDKKINNNEYLNQFKKIKKTLIIKSNICGLGKSTKIKNKILNTRKKYIYFQIGGVFTRKELFERVKNEMPFNEKIDYILHIDLTYTELNNLVMEFLFKFLIMKYYDYNNNIFSYNPKNVEIYIELHNEILNYIEKYPILKFCECNEDDKINYEKLAPLIDEDYRFDKEITIKDSKIQIVSQIFKYLKEKKIGLKNIPLNSKELLPLNKVEEKNQKENNFSSCQQLIDYYFNTNINNEKIEIKNPNYYQKKMFINLLAEQFLKFTKSFYYEPSILFENFSIRLKSEKKAKIKTTELRELIINSLINNTKLFVKGPYENLIKEQKETEKYIISDEDQQNQNEIKKLAEKKLTTMITYDNIKQSIFAFDDDKDSIGIKIIPSSQIKEEEYKQLNELYNSQTPLGQEIRLEKPIEKEKQDKLIEDLLDLLGVLEKKSRESTKEKKKEKFGTYVFTTDNYIKMIHILMKTRARIPVIMMGETGCGKTSLIKMLSLLKNKGEINMKILNIHEGVGDDEIISFLEKTMKESEEEDQRIIIKEKKKYYETYKETNINYEDVKENDNQKKVEKKKKNKNIKKKDIKKENKNVKDNENKEDKADNDYMDTIKKRDKYFEELEKEIKERQMWIFFDEINTCNSLGLISEIFCNHSYRGKHIPDKYIFIGACNPYRILSDNTKNMEFGLYLKNKKRKNLVYTVNPLPHSLLNYVIDFGELTQKDTELYINSILKEVIKSNNYRNDLLNFAVNLVKESHLFSKKNNDVSSVSLRDIKYFIIFYKGFIDYFSFLKSLAIKQNLKNPKNMNNVMLEYKDMTEEIIKKRSINLSVYISYYLRLPTKELREELSNKLDKIFKYSEYFINAPIKDSNFLLDQININQEKGIARNNALRENIFCEFFCLINKVPLIICGKPGNSKTLSVQLLLDSMKGSSSLNDFFKCPKFKEVVQYPFQGSITCTYKGILKTFQKARNYISKNGDLMNALVFFEEMGLAEESPSNPLKVLHAELENEENKVSFFGLTNWALDASKMNRGIRICVQDPDEEDLKYTSFEIANSIDEIIFNENKKLFIFLSKSYFKFKQKESGTGYKDFHGNRDFYNLIRTTMKYLKEEKEKENNLEKIQNICAIKAIERNFGGYINSVDSMKKIFYEISNFPDIKHQYNIVNCIEDNFKDPNSRYLLLISKNSTSQNLVEHIIKNENKQSVIYIGSQFKGDRSESYTEDILIKIQMQMENNVILTLKSLELIYPSLYDLFNQNFVEINGDKYSKISFSNNRATSKVNNDFKVIVLVDDKMVLYEDKPFLNRFEKHVISFENILAEKYINLVKEIDSIIKDLIKFDVNDDKNEKKLAIDLGKQLISCDKEIIENMIFNLTDNNNDISDKEIKAKILEIIAPTLTQDIIASININGFKQREPELTNIIINAYNKAYASNIFEFLKNIPSIIYSRNIIYTFSDITEPIFIDQEIQNEKLKVKFNKEKTTEIVIDSIDTTYNFEQIINIFYKSQKNLCIIKFETDDLNKMNNIKNIIDNTEKIESTRNFKFYLFIVYMKRELFNNNSKENNNLILNKEIIIKDQIPLMSEFNQITIDNINNDNNKYNISDLFSFEKKII